MGNGLRDHLLGDLIEGHTVRLGITQTQKFLQVPGNRLALPVRVRCQIHGFGLIRSLFQFLDQILFSLHRDIVRIKTVQIHTHRALWQITQVTHAGLDHIVRTQIFSNSLCLGG